MTRALKFRYGGSLYFTSPISSAERDLSSEEAPSISAYQYNDHWVEIRRHPRKNYRTYVNFSTQDRAYSDYIRDISVAGVFIETQHPLQLGEELSMMIPFSEGGKSVRVKGVVVRKTPDGVGVEFKNMKRSS